MDSVLINLFTPRKPERVLFLLDTSTEQQAHEVFNEPPTFTKKKKFAHIKRAVEIFIRSKAQMDDQNQYAIMTADSTVLWHVEFTAKVDIIVQYLRMLEATSAPGPCDLDNLAYLLRQRMEIVEGQELPYALHILFLYTRNTIQPTLSDSSLSLFRHPDVHFDFLQACESRLARSDARSLPVFLTRLERPSNYFTDVGSDVDKLLNVLSLCSAHPNQRSAFSTVLLWLQKQREYRAKSSSRSIRRPQEQRTPQPFPDQQLRLVDKAKGRILSSRPFSAFKTGQKLYHSTFRSQASAQNLAEKIRIYSPPPPLSRAQTQPIPYDKEHLYSEALQLKTRNNFLEDDNRKLRTSLLSLQKELSKRLESKPLTQLPTNVHLIASLKQAVNDLKSAVNAREETMELMKRDIRATRVAELSAQVETLQEECRRLASGVEARLREEELNRRADWVDELRHENQLLRVEGERSATAQRETAAQLQKAEELLKDCKAEREQFAGLQSALEDSYRSLEATKHRNEQLEIALSACKSTKKELKKELNSLKETHSQAISSLQGVQISLESEKNTNFELNREISGLKSALSEAAQAFQAAKSEETAVVQDITRIHDEERKAAQAEIAHLRDRLEGQETAVRTALNTAADLERRNISLEIGLQEAGERKEALERTLIALKGENEEGKRQFLACGLRVEAQMQEVADFRRVLGEVLEKPLAKIAKRAENADFTVESLIRRLDPEKKGVISGEELKKGLGKVGVKVKKRYLKAIQTLLGNKMGLIDLDQLRNCLIRCKTSSNSEESPPIPMLNPILAVAPHSKQVETAYEDSFGQAERPVLPSVPLKTEPEIIVEGRTVRLEASSQPASPYLEQMLATLLRHLSLRYQLHRVPSAAVPSALFGPQPDRPVPIRDLKAVLDKAPAEVKQEREKQLLALMLLGLSLNEDNLAVNWDEKPLNAGKAGEMLMEKLGNWEIFSESDEKEFDALTTSALTSISTDFQILCATKDSNQSGFISFEAFSSVLQSLDVHFTPRHHHYLSLLLYSQVQSLDTVSYMSLLSAYVGKEEDSDEVLKEIAAALLASKQHPRDVFLFDMQGFVRISDLEIACRNLHLSLSRSALESLIRGLRTTLSSEACVHVKDLEAALEQFGVEIPEYKLTSTGHFDQGSSRKSSSEEVNDEESPEKRLSDASPFVTTERGKRPPLQDIAPSERLMVEPPSDPLTHSAHSELRYEEESFESSDSL